MKNTRFIMFLATLLFMTLIISACQPTPTEEVVINKGNSNLENIIQETPNENVKINASDIWKETIKSQVGDAEINIDAEVDIPNTETYSVYGTRPVPFTEEQVTSLCKVFFSGREMFQLNDEMTKEDYANKILEQKAYLLELQSHKDNMSEKELEEEINRVNDLIDQYTKAYEDAPETVMRKQIDEIKFSNLGLCDGINIMSKMEDGKWDYLSVGNVENNLSNGIHYYIGSIEHYPIIKIFQGSCIEGHSLSLKDAETLANSMMGKLGLQNDYSIYAVYTEGSKKADTYMIRFARKVEGVSAALIDQNYGQESAVYDDGKIPEKEEYREPWPYEYIEIDVQEDGIKDFIWQRPGKIVETINENVTMLPFEEVQKIFRNQISILNFETGRSKVIAININKVVLGLMRIPVQNTTNDYYLLPVWDFFGEVTFNNGTVQVNDDSFLTINAVDGSIINRSLGY